ncbi:MAG: isoprenylcysteine carboxylmethyltransferase family protein [Anaerolineaceae bacterium]|nr:isoprenylcysteine carboxylmethyltransferase family protein [Anaerolineaceae bacterium]
MAVETVMDGVVAALAIALLIAVYVSWLLTYRTSKQRPVGSSFWFALPAGAQIAGGFGITLLSIFFGCLLWIPLVSVSSPVAAWILRLSGLALVVCGVALWFWSRRTLGRMMGISTSSAAQLQVNHVLVQHGPYAFVRHPMYVSYWCLLAGLLVMYRTITLLILLALMVASMSRRAGREEQVLRIAFGTDWESYAGRVPKFFPRIRRD